MPPPPPPTPHLQAPPGVASPEVGMKYFAQFKNIHHIFHPGIEFYAKPLKDFQIDKISFLAGKEG